MPKNSACNLLQLFGKCKITTSSPKQVLKSFGYGGRGNLALGWGMAGRFKGDPFETGQLLDVAFTIERNNHRDFGGHLQLNLRDWMQRLASWFAKVVPVSK